MHNKEGVTQGDPLSRVAYGIRFLRLIKQLKAAYPDVTQPWYAENASALGTFDNIGSYFNALNCFGPGHGYFLKPRKSILIVH